VYIAVDWMGLSEFDEASLVIMIATECVPDHLTNHCCVCARDWWHDTDPVVGLG
jgi:hypothetical protein